MSLNIFWFLPTHGDGKYLGTSEGARAVDHGYLGQIAQAADRLVDCRIDRGPRGEEKASDHTPVVLELAD